MASTKLPASPARALMIQGTGSDVGKSLIVAGLARAFIRRGLAVRPFKPQNMSNNAAVTRDGGEIGRAQALQARACLIEPHTDMNPVLLKPQSPGGAQIVVQGRVIGSASAADYLTLKPALLPRVLESFHRQAAQADLVLVEGAGSPAEINLRAGDIANMGFAEAAEVPVVLVGDIERGGVIASICGTWELLPAPERARIKGYVINKFRGEVSIFTPAIDIIRERTGLECLGIVPYFARATRLPPEDSLALSRPAAMGSTGRLIVAVPRLPSIANFDDLDPLAAEPDVDLRIVMPGSPLPRDAALIILPGAKATMADLAALRAEGWDIDILAHRRAGGHVLGLCGGYQMLGNRISDPEGVEGIAGGVAGLGLLDVETVLGGDKVLVRRRGYDAVREAGIDAYEMHLGTTSGAGRARPFATLDGADEGAVSPDGRVAGTYLHGLFAADSWRRAFLAGLGAKGDPNFSYEGEIETILDGLAEHLERHLDVARLWEIAGFAGASAP